jgi:hypothetical protein
MPTSDSQYFRGLTEYFINTKNLDASQLNHAYFQWPSFFFLSDIVTSVSGLKLIDFEFILYATIGVLLSVTLYVYASKLFRHGAFLVPISFFISIYWFINYQSVPFSLALALTFVLFMLETHKKNTSVMVTILLLFSCISFTHFFIALFFIIYLIFRSLISRSKQYAALSLLTISIYLLAQITLGSWNWIEYNLRGLLTWSPEYNSVVQEVLYPASMPLDVIAQIVSRTLTIAVVLVCITGLAFMLKRRRLRAIDGAILLAGVTYLSLGLVIYSMGSRALPIFFIPLSVGAACLLETKFKSYVKGLFLVVLILFVFVPIHNSYNSFYGDFVPFQTKENSNAEHFILDRFNWKSHSVILAHAPVEVYLHSSLDMKQTNVTFESDTSPIFPRWGEYNCLLYTIGLGVTFLKYNYTLEKIVNEEKLNIEYDNGFSRIAVRASANST